MIAYEDLPVGQRISVRAWMYRQELIRNLPRDLLIEHIVRECFWRQPSGTSPVDLYAIPTARQV